MANLITGNWYEKQWLHVKPILQKFAECKTIQNVFDMLEKLYSCDLHNVKFVIRGLKKFFNTISKENPCFMHVKKITKTMKYIAKLALELENVIKSDEIEIFTQGQRKTRILNRMQAAALLSHSFLCIHPEGHRNDYMPSVNFTGTFQVMEETEVEKIKCILNYFHTLSKENQQYLEKQSIIYERVCLPQQQICDWQKLRHSNKFLCDFEVNEALKIENSDSTYAKVDFANKYLGGGVLNTGCLQEEIMFTICPELICGMLFMEAMKLNEAIIIAGYKKYSNFSGYARELKYEGPYNDKSNKYNVLVAMDAMDFRNERHDKQYNEKLMLREINKSFTAFHKFGTYKNLDQSNKCDKISCFRQEHGKLKRENSLDYELSKKNQQDTDEENKFLSHDYENNINCSNTELKDKESDILQHLCVNTHIVENESSVPVNNHYSHNVAHTIRPTIQEYNGSSACFVDEMNVIHSTETSCTPLHSNFPSKVINSEKVHNISHSDNFEYLKDKTSSDIKGTDTFFDNQAAKEEKFDKISKSIIYPEMVATGNWGCGAFLGDPQLKAMLQWIAASEAGCTRILYCTLGHKELHNLSAVTQQLKANKATVGSLVRTLENVDLCQLPLFNVILHKRQYLTTFV